VEIWAEISAAQAPAHSVKVSDLKICIRQWSSGYSIHRHDDHADAEPLQQTAPQQQTCAGSSSSPVITVDPVVVRLAIASQPVIP
jgi:hypothetical protein